MKRIKYWICNLKLKRMRKEKYNALIKHYLKMKIDAQVEIESMPHTNGSYVSNIYKNRKSELGRIIATSDKMIRIVQKQKREL